MATKKKTIKKKAAKKKPAKKMHLKHKLKRAKSGRITKRKSFTDNPIGAFAKRHGLVVEHGYEAHLVIKKVAKKKTTTKKRK